MPVNLVMDNVQEMREELDLLRGVGGVTVCELSCTGIRCKPHQPQNLAQLAQLTGDHKAHHYRRMHGINIVGERERCNCVVDMRCIYSVLRSKHVIVGTCTWGMKYAACTTHR